MTDRNVAGEKFRKKMEASNGMEMNNSSKLEAQGSTDDLRYYLACPLRKGQPRIAVTVCHKQRCLFLGSKDGKLICTYAGMKPRVNKIDRDGLL